MHLYLPITTRTYYDRAQRKDIRDAGGIIILADIMKCRPVLVRALCCSIRAIILAHSAAVAIATTVTRAVVMTVAAMATAMAAVAVMVTGRAAMATLKVEVAAMATAMAAVMAATTAAAAPAAPKTTVVTVMVGRTDNN